MDKKKNTVVVLSPSLLSATLKTTGNVKVLDKAGVLLVQLTEELSSSLSKKDFEIIKEETAVHIEFLAKMQGLLTPLSDSKVKGPAKPAEAAKVKEDTKVVDVIETPVELLEKEKPLPMKKEKRKRKGFSGVTRADKLKKTVK